jgi:hypothetical protein
MVAMGGRRRRIVRLWLDSCHVRHVVLTNTDREIERKGRCYIRGQLLYLQRRGV